MSEMEYKTVVRLPIPQLDGKSYDEALPFFKKTVGEPSNETTFDGEVDWFDYEDKPYEPVYDYETGRWGVDKVLVREWTEQEKDLVAMTVAKLREIEQEMQRKFDVWEDVFLLPYSWYNGVDEPIIMDATSGQET